MEAQSDTSQPVVVLPDGTITFRIQHADGSESAHTVDIVLLKMASERCEDKHALEVKDGRFVPTPEFLQDLVSEFARLGIEDCTPTVAHLLWVTIAAEFAKLKKTTDGMQ